MSTKTEGSESKAVTQKQDSKNGGPAKPKAEAQEKAQAKSRKDVTVVKQARGDGATHVVLEDAEDFWLQRTAPQRQDFLERTFKNYKSILDEFLKSANLSIQKQESAATSHARWRKWMIWATGGLAIVNLLAAYKPGSTEPLALWGYLSLVAAVYAAVLAILHNLETFHGHASRAQAYRKTRELFLDAYRDLSMEWHVNIPPRGDSAQACVYASRLYEKIILKDREIRGTVLELTEQKSKDLEVTANNE